MIHISFNRWRLLIMAFIFLFLIAGCASDKKTANGPGETGWELTWNDEFEGTALDVEKWNHETGGHGWGNEELQYYTNRMENTYIDSGYLVIEAREEAYEGNPYTSARLTSRLKGDWKYGRMVVRARLPEGQGIWPAIWMMPSGSVYGGWPASGEIDIMELLGHQPERTYGTLHYGGGYQDHASSGTSLALGGGKTFADAFHEFTLEWEAGEIRWYVDDYLFFMRSEWYTSGGPYPAPFDQAFFLILNIAVGGRWPGYPDETTVFPQRMKVDYVRVYKHKGYTPEITIVTPGDGYQCAVNETITLDVETQDEDGTVEAVEFLADGRLIATSGQEPFSAGWTPDETGTYRIIAKARDNDGRTGLSGPVEVFVGQ